MSNLGINNQQSIGNGNAFPNDTNVLMKTNQEKHVSIDLSSFKEGNPHIKKRKDFVVPQFEPIKSGDIVKIFQAPNSPNPILGFYMKVREISDQIVTADFLNTPIIGRSDQFVKIAPNSLFNLGKSVYEVEGDNTLLGRISLSDSDQSIKQFTNNYPMKQNSNSRASVETQCDIVNLDLFRSGDLIETSDGQIGIILRILRDNFSYVFLDLNNNQDIIECDKIQRNFPNDNSCTDKFRNRLFIGDSVTTKDGNSGNVLATYKGQVLIYSKNNGMPKFYIDKDLILNNNDNYNNDNNYNYNKNTSEPPRPNNDRNGYNGYNDRNNYDSYNDRKGYDNYNDRKGYDNDRNNYDNYNDRGRFNNYNDRVSYNNYNDRGYDNMNRNQYDSNRPTPPPPPNKVQSAPQLKPAKLEKPPGWVCKNCMVSAPDKEEDALISSIKGSDTVAVQFFDKNGNVSFKSYEYKISDLKPLPIHTGQSVIVPKYYSSNKDLIGKVVSKTAHHYTIDPGKKRGSFIEVQSKEAFRYYDWDNLEKI